MAEHVDRRVLFSGDGDFRPVIEAVQRRGAYATVISTISTPSPMIGDELRRQTDLFGRVSLERPAPDRSVEKPPLA